MKKMLSTAFMFLSVFAFANTDLESAEITKNFDRKKDCVSEAIAYADAQWNSGAISTVAEYDAAYYGYYYGCADPIVVVIQD
ncbi:hypothetical protein NBRC110019_32600 [Neptunitalea chrysea]|uniref:Uncharacterized protein n=1 Tax=Neptunitalea chrysea TaxID=1647581 RepID=A0A9W6EV33_9FLAO|nr:hypothetical protein [Neptunitalea chrysea]GLB54215.1 hypothetical protein NBRC110019_32600 [Neptunitalea chrysea]